jgi:tetratricopeptide (TPR) repeat protein
MIVALSACARESDLARQRRIASVRQETGEGDRLLAEGQQRLAVEKFRAALDLDPGHPAAHLGLARAAEARGDLEAAARHYGDTIKLAPMSFDCALALARCQRRAASTSLQREALLHSAARAYRHAQSLRPADPTAALELAACCRELGRLDEAARALHEAARRHPRKAALYNELAAIRLQEGDLHGALRAYADALRAEPDNTDAHNGCARANSVLARQGGSRGGFARQCAVAHLRRSLKINPKQAEVREWLARLEPYEWRAVTATEGAFEAE